MAKKEKAVVEAQNQSEVKSKKAKKVEAAPTEEITVVKGAKAKAAAKKEVKVAPAVKPVKTAAPAIKVGAPVKPLDVMYRVEFMVGTGRNAQGKEAYLGASSFENAIERFTGSSAFVKGKTELYSITKVTGGNFAPNSLFIS
jgi:hypothetical protein